MKNADVCELNAQNFVRIPSTSNKVKNKGV